MELGRGGGASGRECVSLPGASLNDDDDDELSNKMAIFAETRMSEADARKEPWAESLLDE